MATDCGPYGLPIPGVVKPDPCSGGGGGGAAEKDVEPILLCDVMPDGSIVGSALAVYTYDEATGQPSGPPTFVDPATGNPYVPQGTLRPCDDGTNVAEFILCDVQTDQSSVQFIRKMVQSSTGAVVHVVDHTFDGAVYAPTGTVMECEPYTVCTPSSDQDLNAQCGPGESPVEDTIRTDKTWHPLANAVFIDDPAADPLCGGSWDNPPAALAAPFPVNETFRNATFDQPGPVLQGTAPYPELTAGAPVNDGAGAGWLRVSDLNGGTNGIWQVPAPFPTAQGVTAAITHASHDGTTPGGDGAAFVFTDGSVPPQSIPIGGFGNLGLNNWDGGYVAVVLDEYGQSCTCDQTPHGTVSPNPGPCGFCTNTISIQLAGALRTGASCACCTVAQMPLAPKAINQTTRSQPLRLISSIISEGGRTYVSASIDWNDGNGPVQYFDRVDVTACAGPPPGTLRMAAFGGSGGAYRAVKEFRDASARPAGSSHWRAFPITTDPIPACVSLVNLTAEVDATFNSDTQTKGNSDPEAYLWLVDTQTNTILKRSEKSSIPTQVGTPNHLSVTASVPPAKVPFLRIYIGSEARDQAGEYDTLWENLKVTASGTGCPAKKQRVLNIAAPCPIPVTIVGGAADGGGGGGTTVVNTPSTFEDQVICATQPDGTRVSGFRREVRDSDGTITVSFLGTDGLAITPTTWSPGACTAERYVSDVVLCDDNGPFVRKFVQSVAQDGLTGEITGVSNFGVDGLPYVPVGTIKTCSGGEEEQTLGEVCYILSPGPPITFRGFMALDENDAPVLFSGSGNVVPAGTYTIVVCSQTAIEGHILCDAGNGDHQFLRTYTESPITGQNAALFDLELDGATAYAVVGPVVVCPTHTRDSEDQVLCDDNGPFLRQYVYDGEDGSFIGRTDTKLDGSTAYVTVGTVKSCSPTPTTELDTEVVVLCDDNGGFLRRFTYDETTGAPGTVTTTDFGGAPYVPVGTVKVCDQSVVVNERDVQVVTLCDDNGAFLRRFTYDEATGLPSGAPVDTTMAGAAYVPVGTVKTCAAVCCPLVVAEVCLANGHPGVIIRNSDGSLSDIDTVTGGPFLATDIVTCPVPPPVLPNVASHHFDAVPGTPWTPAAIPAGRLVGLSYTVISGTATVVDADGTSIAAIPAGFTATWNVQDDRETLTPPTSITAAAASRAIVTMVVATP